MANEVRIRVLASADDSLRSTFRPFEEAAAQARKKVGAATAGIAKDNRSAASALARQAERDTRQAATERVRQAATFERAETARRKAAADAAIREQRRASDAMLKDFDRRLREGKRMRDQEEREILQSAARSERAQSRATAVAKRQADEYRKSFARGAVSGVATVGRAAVRLGSNIGAGAGLDFSAQNLTRQHVMTEEVATRATGAGKMALGQKATASDVAESMGAIRAAGTANNILFSDMAEALEAFVGKSSDLDLGRKMLTEIGMVANATGSSLQDMATGAGAIAQNLEEKDPAKRLEKVRDVLRLITTQTTKGSVEMKDLATYMPRLSANANKFGHDFKRNIGELGTIAQMAMKGGRSTASEATNTAAAMPRDLVKGPMLDRLKKAGINPFVGGVGGMVSNVLSGGKTKNTEMRALSDIIVDVFEKTGGDQAKIADMFKNENSKSGVMAFAEVYKKDGAEGIRKAFAEMGSSGEDGIIDNSADMAKNTLGGKARGLQNQAQGLAGQGLEAALNNPKATLAVLAAGLVGGGLVGGLMGGGGGVGGLLGGGGAGGLGGLAGAGGTVPVAIMAIAGAAAAAWFAGKAAIDEEVEGKEKAAAEIEKTRNEIASERATGVATRDDSVRQEMLARLEARRVANDAAQAAIPRRSGGFVTYNSDEDFHKMQQLRQEEDEILAAKRKIAGPVKERNFGWMAEMGDSWTGGGGASGGQGSGSIGDMVATLTGKLQMKPQDIGADKMLAAVNAFAVAVAAMPAAGAEMPPRDTVND